jgi:Domain of unknown function (DUF4157)
MMKDFDEQVIANLHAKPVTQTKDGRPRSTGSDLAGSPLGHRRVLHLQRTAGNAAVVQLLAGEESEGEQSQVRNLIGKGGGTPLPAKLRRSMEDSFGQDFSDVRVHSDGQAESSARSVQAKAYTVGNEIVLGSDSPSLDSDAGQHTLAHELTHVVQQRSGPVDGTEVGGGIQVSDPSDRFERQAEQVADDVVSHQASGRDATATAGSASGGGFSVQRDEEGDEEGSAGDLPIQRQDEEEEEEGEQEGG